MNAMAPMALSLLLAFAIATKSASAKPHSVCEDEEATSETARAVLQSRAELPESEFSLPGEATSKPAVMRKSSKLDNSKAIAPDPRLSVMGSSLKKAVEATHNGLGAHAVDGHNSLQAGGHNAPNTSATSALMDFADLSGDARVLPCTGCKAPTTKVATATVFTMQAPAWSLVSTNSGPPPRKEHTAIYVDALDAMYVFGGRTDDSYTTLDDLWVFSLATNSWAPVTTNGGNCPARMWHSAIYATATNTMYIHGGYGPSAAFKPMGVRDWEMNDTWALDLASHTWASISTTGGPVPLRSNHAAVYVAATNSMYIYGGNHGQGNSSTVWVLNLETKAWAFVPTSGGPTGRGFAAAIYAPAANAMYVYSGVENSGVENTTGNVFEGLSNDVWTLNFDTFSWASVTTSGGPAEGRSGATAIYVDAANSMLVFAGNKVGQGAQNDLWALDLTTSSWANVTATGGTPPARSLFTAIYTPATSAMYAYGGQGADGKDLNDVWALSLLK